MDTIARHAKRLIQCYSLSASSIEVIDSAKELARIVLHNPSLLPKHKRKILSEVQWLISEVDGKYRTRFRSKQVVDLARTSPRSLERIQHEHVISRKEITARLLANPNDASMILDQVTACVVTKDEHNRLRGRGIGWPRYREARIEVYDISTDPPLILNIG